MAKSVGRSENAKSTHFAGRTPHAVLARRQVASYPEWLKWTCRHCSCNHALTYACG